MLDHLSIQCADVAASAAFYESVLAPLGGRRVMDFGEVIGFPGYYAVFVRDPDGNKVEAVCHAPG